MSLIVNADDFGKSEEVNRAIVECFEKGYINRTTVMVNMPFAKQAFVLAKEHGFADKVGLHINLTEGKPLTEGIKLNEDFCSDGVFTAAFYKSTMKRLRMDNDSIRDITSEIRAQIEEYKQLGFTLNHLDSHHHVHTNYPVYKALRSLSKDYDFSSIRLSRNLYEGGSRLNRIYKNIFNRSIKKICGNTTDYFGSFIDAAQYFASEGNTPKGDDATAKFSSFCSKYDLEIMVHPMYKNGELMDTDIPFTKEILLYEA